MQSAACVHAQEYAGPVGTICVPSTPATAIEQAAIEFYASIGNVVYSWDRNFERGVCGSVPSGCRVSVVEWVGMEDGQPELYCASENKLWWVHKSLCQQVASLPSHILDIKYLPASDNPSNNSSARATVAVATASSCVAVFRVTQGPTPMLVHACTRRCPVSVGVAYAVKLIVPCGRDDELFVASGTFFGRVVFWSTSKWPTSCSMQEETQDGALLAESQADHAGVLMRIHFLADRKPVPPGLAVCGWVATCSDDRSCVVRRCSFESDPVNSGLWKCDLSVISRHASLHNARVWDVVLFFVDQRLLVATGCEDGYVRVFDATATDRLLVAQRTHATHGVLRIGVLEGSDSTFSVACGGFDGRFVALHFDKHIADDLSVAAVHPPRPSAAKMRALAVCSYHKAGHIQFVGAGVDADGVLWLVNLSGGHKPFARCGSVAVSGSDCVATSVALTHADSDGRTEGDGFVVVVGWSGGFLTAALLNFSIDGAVNMFTRISTQSSPVKRNVTLVTLPDSLRVSEPFVCAAATPQGHCWLWELCVGGEGRQLCAAAEHFCFLRRPITAVAGCPSQLFANHFEQLAGLHGARSFAAWALVAADKGHSLHCTLFGLESAFTSVTPLRADNPSASVSRICPCAPSTHPTACFFVFVFDDGKTSTYGPGAGVGAALQPFTLLKDDEASSAGPPHERMLTVGAIDGSVTSTNILAVNSDAKGRIYTIAAVQGTTVNVCDAVSHRTSWSFEEVRAFRTIAAAVHQEGAAVVYSLDGKSISSQCCATSQRAQILLAGQACTNVRAVLPRRPGLVGNGKDIHAVLLCEDRLGRLVLFVGSEDTTIAVYTYVAAAGGSDGVYEWVRSGTLARHCSNVLSLCAMSCEASTSVPRSNLVASAGSLATVCVWEWDADDERGTLLSELRCSPPSNSKDCNVEGVPRLTCIRCASVLSDGTVNLVTGGTDGAVTLLHWQRGMRTLTVSTVVRLSCPVFSLAVFAHKVLAGDSQGRLHLLQLENAGANAQLGHPISIAVHQACINTIHVLEAPGDCQPCSVITGDDGGTICTTLMDTLQGRFSGQHVTHLCSTSIRGVAPLPPQFSTGGTSNDIVVCEAGKSIHFLLPDLTHRGVLTHNCTCTTSMAMATWHGALHVVVVGQGVMHIILRESPSTVV